MLQFFMDNWGNVAGVIGAALVVVDKLVKMVRPQDEAIVAKIEETLASFGIKPPAPPAA